MMQLFGVMNIVNSEPIAICHSEIDGSEGDAIDDGSELREKLEDIFFAAVLFILHSIGNRAVVTCFVVSHCATLLLRLL